MDARADGLRITKVGLWFGLLSLVVLLAASNTGNNGLYLVLALMLGALAVSQVLGSANVRGLAVEVTPPDELFVNRLARFELRITNLNKFLPRWLLVTTFPADEQGPGVKRSSAWLTSWLAPGGEDQGAIEVLPRRRGLWKIQAVHTSSLFPFGFFRKGQRQPTALEMLIYPELLPLSSSLRAQLGRLGEVPSRRIGRGQELMGLRPLRPGDDPRGIHWKQSARAGQLIFKEQAREEIERLSLVFDNAVGPLTTPAAETRFERLVSEAASVAVAYLERGFAVELLTRDQHLPFGSGPRQRWAILCALATISPRAASAEPLLLPEAQPTCVRLAMESMES